MSDASDRPSPQNAHAGNTCGEALLQLLRAALWGETPDSRLFASLDAGRWMRVSRMARVQTVSALACQGLTALPDECLPAEPLLVRWMADQEAVRRASRRMNEALAGLFHLFQRHGLQPVLLKGQGVARMYPMPLLRECGDIDLYFPSPHQAAGALAVLHEAGIVVRRMPDGSHAYWWQGIPVEHHPRLTDLANPLMHGRLREWESLYPAQQVPLGMGHDIQVDVPSPTMLLFLLSIHILKHVLGWGIGLRQLADMAVACRLLHGQADGGALRRMSAQAHVSRWQGLLCGALVGSFHLPVGDLPFPCRLRDGGPLIERVWADGNFGQMRQRGTLPDEGVFMRKWHTALAFLGHARFALSCAPAEAVCTVGQLAWGQLKS